MAERDRQVFQSCGSGGVANVERDGKNAWQLKAIGVVISTFATLPWGDNTGVTPRQCYASPNAVTPYSIDIAVPWASSNIFPVAYAMMESHLRPEAKHQGGR